MIWINESILEYTIQIDRSGFKSMIINSEGLSNLKSTLYVNLKEVMIFSKEKRDNNYLWYLAIVL